MYLRLNFGIMKKLFFTFTVLMSLAFVLNAQIPSKVWLFDTPEWGVKQLFNAPEVVDDLLVLADSLTPVTIENTNKVFSHLEWSYNFTKALRLGGPAFTAPSMPFLPIARAVHFQMNGPGYMHIVSLSSTVDSCQLLITDGKQLLHRITVQGNNFVAENGSQLLVNSYHHLGGPSPIFIFAEDGSIDLFGIEAETGYVVPPVTGKVWVLGNDTINFPLSPGIGAGPDVSVFVDNLGIHTGSATTANMAQVEPSSKTFGENVYINRFKFNGGGYTGSAATDSVPTLNMPTQRYLTMKVTGPGMIRVQGVTGSSSSGRRLFVTDGADLIGSVIFPPSTEISESEVYYAGGPAILYLFCNAAINLYRLEASSATVHNSGDFLPGQTVVFNVNVPAGTKECWVAGSFNGWNSNTHQMQKVDDVNYTLTVPDVNMSTLEYKYLSGPASIYRESDAYGQDVPNRIHQLNDTVANWYSVYDPGTVVSKNITFEVTVPNHVQAMYVVGGFNNWRVGDQQTRMVLQGITPTGKLFSTTLWVNDLNLEMGYKFVAGPDWGFVQTQEDDFHFTSTEVDTVRHNVFGFYQYANISVQPKDWNFSEMYFDQDLVEFNETLVDDGLLLMGQTNAVISIDRNNKFNDQLNFTHRLKTNGFGWMDTEKPNLPFARALAFNVGGDCQIAVMALSASSSEMRELVFSNGVNILGSMQVPGTYAGAEGNVPMYIFNYQGPMSPVYVYSPNGGINFYYLGVSNYAGVPQNQTSVTYTVKVPLGTNQVCIAGAFNNWNPGMNWMQQIDSVTYQTTIQGATESMEYKYFNGPNWGFEEVTATGQPVGNRTWTALDEVQAWSNTVVPDEIRIIYDDVHTSTGEDIAIDIRMSSNQPRQAIAYQFELHFDANTLEYTGYTTQGTVADNGELAVNSTTEMGVLYISFMTTQAFDIANSLIKLNFKVVNNYSYNQTSLWFNECYIDDHQIYNYHPGTIFIDNFMLGDVDGNQRVQAYDAALTLQYSVGMDPLPTIAPRPWEGWRLQVADVDGVAGITANDAAMILQYSAYIITSFDGHDPDSGIVRAPANNLAQVEIVRDQDMLYFKSFGNLVGFNLFIAQELDAFGTPVISNDVNMSAVNVGSDIYAVGLATLEPLADGTTFMTIPLLREVSSEFEYKMFINSDEVDVKAYAQTGVSSLADAGISLYPNPVKDIIRLNNLKDGSLIRVYDISGRMVLSTETFASFESIDVKGLANGIYSISILNNGSNAVSKFIKY